MKKRILSLILVFTMCVSLSVGAFAEETSGSGTVIGAVEVETTAGNNETVNVTIEIGSSDNADGTTTTVTESKAEDFVTDSGAVVDYSAKSETITDEEGNTLPGSTSESEYTSTKNDGNYVYNAEGGSDSKVIETTPEMTVDVPTKEGQSNTANGNEVGSTVTTGDVRESEDDGIYDYTTETVIQSGSVTVDNTKVEVKVDAVESEYESDLEYVKSEANATADNDLTDLVGRVFESDAAEIKEAGKGYQYVLVGTQNVSQFWAQVVYNSPQYEGEKPVFTYTDKETGEEKSFYRGNGYYHSCYNAEGVYVDGEMITEDTVEARWSSVENFMLVDPATGKITTTYCADSTTPTVNGYSYNMENVEDAEYYTSEQAAMIRTVALNGYWGAEEGTGSIENVKQLMRDAKDADGNAVFTQEEIDALSEGAAMAATQFAIWTFSNYMDDMSFINTQYIPKDGENQTDLTLINDKSRPKPGTNKVYTWVDFLKNVPESEKDTVDVIFKLYNHLVNMEPTEIEDPDTTNTVITKDNFIKDMSVSVIEKVEDHVNNTDADSSNDAYTTELKFALVVTPSTENGDDMIVQVIGPNGVEAEARIAGTPAEGETMQYLTPDENGNFTFSGITMIEGNQQFNITLQGIQNLEQGVYLYSSEVRTDDNGEEVPSQTMVGIAGGAHAVNVSMEISFDLNVEDEVVAVEHVWRTEHDPGEDPPQWDPPVPLNDEPEEEIIIEDEAVPLAQAPHTGSGSALYAVMAAMSALGLAGVNLGRKTNTRGKHEL